MAKEKKITKTVTKPVVVKPAPVAKFRYLCPACTNNAVESSNKMMGVKVTCPNCGHEIVTDDANRWLNL